MTPVNRVTLATQLEHAIRRDIIDGVLAPGHRLRAAELGGQYSVSATPLREALQRLAAEGLVDMNPGTGMVVPGVTRADLDDTYWVRGMLEVMAVQRSIERGDTTWATLVETAYVEFRDATVATQRDSSTEGLVTQTRAHRAFHDSLISACGSKWILRLLRTLNDHAERYRMLNVTSGLVDTLDDHAGLAAAAVARHPHLTELLWAHRADYLARLEERLDQDVAAEASQVA